MRTILIALLFFLLGLGAFWGYNKYQGLMIENEKLKQEVSKIPSSSLDPTPTLEPGYEPEEAPTGVIEGALGYPSEGIPPLDVIAINVSDPSIFFKVSTKENQGTYVIENVTPGIYKVIAYPQGKPVSNFSGGYSKAVPCGLSVICTDHSLISVEVKSGQTTAGIDPKDWYAPENSFPVKPQ